MKERGNRLLRLIDRYLGIPLVFGLKWLKIGNKALPTSIGSIALLKSAGIGDLCLLMGVIADLQKGYPEATITLFTGKSNACMGKLIPGVRLVPLPMTRPFKALKIIRECSFDCFIDCDPWPRINALLTFLSKSSMTIGFWTKGQYRHSLYDRVVPHETDCHELENYRRLIKAFGCKTGSLPILKKKEGIKRRRIVCHLYSGGLFAHLKMWDRKNWKQLFKALLDEEFEIVFTGGHGEKGAIDLLAHEMDDNRVKSVAGCSLDETVKLLKSSFCLISVDTGIMHLGSILGCDVIALHGPTSPKHWGGIGPNVVAITGDGGENLYLRLGFERAAKNNRSMETITPKQILDVVLKIEQKEERIRREKEEEASEEALRSHQGV